MPAGRPLKFKSVEELDTKIAEYFAYCDEQKKPYTVTGLAIYLDTSRETISEYYERPEFVDIIRKAKDKCEGYLVENALQGKNNPVFSIFVLKNSYGYKDKTELDHSSSDGSMSPVANLTDEQLIKLAQKHDTTGV